jgi:16S rRNA (guanine966-N2)-methyltransferase
MRIISGSLSGHQFASPKAASTHPMSEKARGGLFNSLGDISGLTVLDVFSGSGALGIEAISRGAASVLSIESDPIVVKVINQNIASLKLEKNMKVVRAFFKSWSNRNTNDKYNIVLADPPYNRIDLGLPTLLKLPRHLKDNGIMVLSWPGKVEPLILDDIKIVRIKKYGDAQLVFYRKIS